MKLCTGEGIALPSFSGVSVMLTTAIGPNMRLANKGDRGRKTMPHSEVCMSMRVAGKEMNFKIKDTEYPCVQLYDDNWREFSFPITTGEAGLYDNGDGYYYYTNDHGG